MIREICKDETFLAQKAAPATAADLGVAQDLMETLIAHKDGCVGMAANMIGVNKRIIVFENDGEYMVMFNPEIVKKSGPYDAEEGCLSLTGIRPAHLKVIVSFIELIDDLLDGRIPSPYGHLFHAWLLDLVLALGAVIGLLVVVDLASGVAATASTARRDGKGHHTCGQCRDCLLHVLHELLL